MDIRKKMIVAIGLFWMGLLGLCACSSPSFNDTEHSQNDTASELVYKNSMDLQYAKNFTVDYYEGGYTMLTTTMDGQRFLVVPEGKEVPKNLEKDIVVLQKPVNNLYLVASAVMDMFSSLDGLDTITFSGQKQENWYIDKAKEAMEKGEILYAGKYNKPDYELIVSKGCTLAIENGMILHSPEVIEKLEDFGIPVMIEYSSYETHPLGRVEWVKFFGALLGKEEQAAKIFKEQTEIIDKVTTDKKTGKTVAFFFVTSNGLIQVRQSSDYVPKMIELAGGKYIFDQLGEEDSKRSTMNMQMEEFYAKAKDADYIIYNSTIDGELNTIDELLAKSNLLADFKAVKNGNVWCTGKNLFQETTELGTMIEDIHTILTTEDDSLEELNYMHKLK